METPKRIFLFDAYALIFRAYYAFINRPMLNSKGFNTSAIYGFATSLLDIIQKEDPPYAAVVFDPPGPTFRNALYPEYKANRQATPEEIRKSVPFIKELIGLLGLPVIEVEGFEADDVIGTLARLAEKESFVIYMVTPDKDFGQLVGPSVFVYKPSRGGNEYELIGPDEVMATFGIDHPSQVIDILALWGDASDNIPGAPGIGEKTARELIGKYKSVENLLKNLPELKEKQRNSLRDNHDLVLLSKKLATICCEVPVDSDLNRLKRERPDWQNLGKFFSGMEFKSLLARIQGENKSLPQQGSLFESPSPERIVASEAERNIMNTPHDYVVINNPVALNELVIKVLQLKEFCFDTETTGLNSRHADIVGLSIAMQPGEAFYIHFSNDREETRQLLECLRPVFEHHAIGKIGQNLKFDIQVLLKYGIRVEGPLFDTMIAHCLVQPDGRHNMDHLAEVYLNYKPVSIEQLIGPKGTKQISMRDVPLDTIKEYAGEDADITLQLAERLRPELKRLGLEPLSNRVEMPLVRVLAEIENEGFNLSVEDLNQYAALLKHELHQTETEIHQMAGIQFNINSPRQLGEVLFEKMKITTDFTRTKTKQYATNEEVLTRLTDKHPIVNKIIDYRAMQKLLGTYVEALPQLIDNQSKRIHTSFDQAFVSTGRLSSKNPNLQNIPIRDERGKEIRKAFIPSDKSHLLLSADYSQIELRIMAHLSGDKSMIKAFHENQDIHISTAAKVYHISPDEVTRAMRAKAKTANFGIIYGISSYGLSQRLNIPRVEASELIRGYFKSFPGVKAYMEQSIDLAKTKGYAETLMGRRRYLPDIHSANAVVRGVAERNAINTPIQGSAADIIKLAMVNIQNRLRGRFKSAMILQVHDELIFNVRIEELDEMKSLVRHEMENAVSLQVPLIVELGTGANWLEAH